MTAHDDDLRRRFAAGQSQPTIATRFDVRLARLKRYLPQWRMTGALAEYWERETSVAVARICIRD